MFKIVLICIINKVKVNCVSPPCILFVNEIFRKKETGTQLITLLNVTYLVSISNDSNIDRTESINKLYESV